MWNVMQKIVTESEVFEVDTNNKVLFMYRNGVLALFEYWEGRRRYESSSANKVLLWIR